MRPDDEMMNGRRWLGIGLAIMFTLIGVAVFIAVAYPILTGSAPPTLIFPGGIWNILWLLIGIWIIAMVFSRPWRRRYRYGRWRGEEDDDPEEILRRRYAKGDISQAEFQRRLADLRKHRSEE